MPPYLALQALRSAFARVHENRGCAGADGVSLSTFRAALDPRLRALRQSVLDGAYFSWPLRKIEIEKRPGSPERRTLLVPSVADRVLQTAVARHIEPALEAEFADCSFGYRRGRGVRQAVHRVHDYFRQGYRWLLDADIDDFFGSVDCGLLLGRLAPLVHDELAFRLIRLWLDYSVWDGLRLSRPGLGLPQGAVISPMLANLCLDALDDALLDAGLKIVRYADDFVVLTKSRKRAERARELTEKTLAALELRLDQGKTRITRYDQGFRFLGVVFLKDLLLQPLPGERRRLKVLSSTPPLPLSFFPARARRPLRRYSAI